MDELGVDVGGLDDLDFGAQLAGTSNYLTAIAKRWLTPPGALFYDPTYGYGLQLKLNADYDTESLYQMAVELEGQAELDPRTMSASVTVVPEGDGVMITAELESLDGPHELVMRVTALTAEVLNV